MLVSVGLSSGTRFRPKTLGACRAKQAIHINAVSGLSIWVSHGRNLKPIQETPRITSEANATRVCLVLGDCLPEKALSQNLNIAKVGGSLLVSL